MRRAIRRISYDRPGRLIPKAAAGLRAGAVRLRPGERMAWHSTGDREELLIILTGRVRVEAAASAATIRRLSLGRGQGLFLPKRTPHAVVNASKAHATYLYVTGA